MVYTMVIGICGDLIRAGHADALLGASFACGAAAAAIAASIGRKSARKKKAQKIVDMTREMIDGIDRSRTEWEAASYLDAAYVLANQLQTRYPENHRRAERLLRQADDAMEDWEAEA